MVAQDGLEFIRIVSLNRLSLKKCFLLAFWALGNVTAISQRYATVVKYGLEINIRFEAIQLARGSIWDLWRVGTGLHAPLARQNSAAQSTRNHTQESWKIEASHLNWASQIYDSCVRFLVTCVALFWRARGAYKVGPTRHRSHTEALASWIASNRRFISRPYFTLKTKMITRTWNGNK